MDEEVWKPLCHGYQYTEWRNNCKICPFARLCKSYTEDYREHLWWTYHDEYPN